MVSEPQGNPDGSMLCACCEMHGIVAAFKVKLSRGSAMEWLANVRRRIAQQLRDHPRLWDALNPPYRASKDVINELRLLRSRRHMTYDASRGNDIVRQAI